jgi:hypothetical protein
MVRKTGSAGVQKLASISKTELFRQWLDWPMLPNWHQHRHPIQIGEPLTATCVTAAVLAKLAKHFALLASLAILGEAGGRIPVGQPAIFMLIVLAALFHAIGRTLRLRSLRQTPLNKDAS